MRLSNEHFNSFIEQTSNKISGDSVRKFDYIIGIARGGLIPATYLSYRTEIPMRTVHIETRSAGIPKVDISVDVTRILDDKLKNLLIVDDIIDSGLTLNILTNRTASDYRIATFVENTDLQTKRILYSHIRISREHYKPWIIFPWDKDC